MATSTAGQPGEKRPMPTPAALSRPAAPGGTHQNAYSVVAAMV
ncbi:MULTISPECIES: hypothetical protein [unclassified Streptomyces]|nr:hypothetical protein [Streptomyces sp. CNQ-509]